MIVEKGARGRRSLMVWRIGMMSWKRETVDWMFGYRLFAVRGGQFVVGAI